VWQLVLSGLRIAQANLFIESIQKSGKLQAVIKTGLADPEGELSIAYGANSIWVLSDKEGELSRIDPGTNSVSSKIKVESNSFALTFGLKVCGLQTPVIHLCNE